jgi:hypothetical protein
LLAVAAAFPGTIRVLGTYMMLKKPVTPFTRYSAPATRAFLLVEFISLPADGDGSRRADTPHSRPVLLDLYTEGRKREFPWSEAPSRQPKPACAHALGFESGGGMQPQRP